MGFGPAARGAAEEMRTLALSFLVAVGTLMAMWIIGLSFFTGAGVIFPTIVAWVAGSVFAWERRPRHLWLHVAAVGILVAALMNLYGFAILRLFPPPYGAPGGPNMPMPMQRPPLPPPR